MRVSTARLLLFLIWSFLWVGYVTAFFLTTLKSGIQFEQAADASWKVTYVLFPIMSAFATYWFLPNANGQPAGPEDSAMLSRQQSVAMFTITGMVNLVVLLFFLFGVILPDYNDPNQAISYHERVDAGIRIMVFLATFVALPVGFLLGRSVPNPVAPPPVDPNGP